jgi:hypothetical protein
MRREMLTLALAVMTIFVAGCGNNPPPPKPDDVKLPEITEPPDPISMPMPAPMPNPMPAPAPMPEPEPAPIDPPSPEPEPTPDPKPLDIPPPADPEPKPGVAARPLEKVGLEEVVAQLQVADRRDAAISELKSRGPAAVEGLVKSLDAAKPEAQVHVVFALGALGKHAAAALPKLRTLAAAEGESPVKDTAVFAIDAIEGE